MMPYFKNKKTKTSTVNMTIQRRRKSMSSIIDPVRI